MTQEHSPPNKPNNDIIPIYNSVLFVDKCTAYLILTYIIMTQVPDTRYDQTLSPGD